MILNLSSNYFPKQHQLVGICSGKMLSFLFGTTSILIYYYAGLVFQGLITEFTFVILRFIKLKFGALIRRNKILN